MVAELSPLLIAQAEAGLRAMHSAADTGDAARIVEASHRLKGSSATLGAQAFAQLCANIEQHACAQTLEAVPVLLPSPHESGS